MTTKEALLILGLKKDYTSKDILNAYQALYKKYEAQNNPTSYAVLKKIEAACNIIMQEFFNKNNMPVITNPEQKGNSQATTWFDALQKKRLKDIYKMLGIKKSPRNDSKILQASICLLSTIFADTQNDWKLHLNNTPFDMHQFIFTNAFHETPPIGEEVTFTLNQETRQHLLAICNTIGRECNLISVGTITYLGVYLLHLIIQTEGLKDENVYLQNSERHKDVNGWNFLISHTNPDAGWFKQLSPTNRNPFLWLLNQALKLRS